MAKETIIRTVLSNGLQVKLKQHPHQRTINLGLFIRHGTQEEDISNSGIAHFIEHVLFNPNHMPPSIKASLDGLLDFGASYEAYTSKEYTRFMITCLPKQVEQAVSILSQLVRFREVTTAAVDHERPIILHEHGMTFSSSNVLKELLDNTIWGDRSLGLFVIGRKDNIQRFTREELEERIRLHYVPERTVLVALGPLDIVGFTNLIEQHFESWQSDLWSFPEPSMVTEPRLAALPTNGARADLLLGYLGVPFTSADRYAMELLADVLGGGMKSRLFVELREKQGLAYLAHAYPVNYALGGYLAIKVNCDKTALTNVYAGIQRELERIKDDGITDHELARAKAARSTALLGTLENSAQHLQLLGRRAILNDDFFVDLEVRRIEAVRLEDVIRLAHTIFVPDNVAMVALGPKDEELLHLI